MEKAMFNYCVRRAKERKFSGNWQSKLFRSCYKQRYLSCLHTLKHYPDVLAKVKSREIKERDLPSMFPWEIDPDKWLPIFDELENRRFAGRRNVENVEGGEKRRGIMACGRCKSWSTDYYQLQTRSADESITSFFTCLDCGKRWKV